ncbi:conserved hypothetical protein [Thiomonas sp. CB3]|nr:conserved hypothetical protein [Thiomonas sp. CB3]
MRLFRIHYNNSHTRAINTKHNVVYAHVLLTSPQPQILKSVFRVIAVMERRHQPPMEAGLLAR